MCVCVQCMYTTNGRNEEETREMQQKLIFVSLSYAYKCVSRMYREYACMFMSFHFISSFNATIFIYYYNFQQYILNMFYRRDE